MRTFADATGHSWVLNLTVGCLRRVKTAFEIDLTAPEVSVDEAGKPCDSSQLTLAQRVASDLMLAVDVLFACVAEEAARRNVTVEDFCEQLPPALCREARKAFLEEWEDFFLQLGREDQAAVVRAARELHQELIAQHQKASNRLVSEALPRLREQIDQETDRLIAELSGNESTNTPASSESTPSP